MVEPLEEPPEGCLAADDLLFLDFPSDLDLNPPTHRRNRNPPLPSSAGGLQDQSLLDILDSTDIPAVDGLPGLAAEGGGSEEEEELEWLSNKDAFPALETSFEIPTHSRSSSGGGTGSSSSAAATAAERARPSPVSVLAVAAPSRVPVRPRSKGQRRRRRVRAGLSPGVVATEAERRRCRHCEAEETPQWRAGPEGPKTLCNACGVRFKSGRLVPEYRPAASPTFVLTQHSNSHRKVMELRRQKELLLLRHENPSSHSSAAAAASTNPTPRPEILFHDYGVC